MTDQIWGRRLVLSFLLAPVGAVVGLVVVGTVADLCAGTPPGQALVRAGHAAAVFAVVGFPIAWAVEAMLVVVSGHVTPGHRTPWWAVLAAGATAGALAMPMVGLCLSGWSTFVALAEAALVGAAMGGASASVYLTVLRGDRRAKPAA